MIYGSAKVVFSQANIQKRRTLIQVLPLGNSFVTCSYIYAFYLRIAIRFVNTCMPKQVPEYLVYALAGGSI